MPQESMATHSLLNQNQPKEEDNKNDAIIPGTFGGLEGNLNNVQHEKRISENNQNSFYNKSPSTSNNFMAGDSDMLSFNPQGPLVNLKATE